ncbi:MAG: ABC transporter ATP-binding protein [Bacteroidales bacterium]|nr:ABC transporter ATP-binding protein [Bacteroidales bacterium]
MKDFLSMWRRFVWPYKHLVGWAVVLNVLSAVFNIFSFTLLIPILNILFKTGANETVYAYMDWGDADLRSVAVNNFYYYVTWLIRQFGPSLTLLFLGLFLGFMTLLKTACYFGSSAVMIPLRTGVVRDIRIRLYRKIVNLPLAFFSEERKGDLMARMSGDVGEIENSITASLDLLLKNPILILFYLTTLILTSWQLTLFTFLVLPGMGWLMGRVGRRLKRKSLEAQSLWSDTMSQLEETLGALRVIKAFGAQNTMAERFSKGTNKVRDAQCRIATRQALAHPMSEFLGTLLIVIVLWFGGILILNNPESGLEASTFIFYLVILYSIIAPFKEFSKASYNIPKGLASMERIDRILQTENTIVEPAHPIDIHSFTHSIELHNVSFSYDGRHKVLDDVSLTIPFGKTVALVGQSGSGKSTLVDLLSRFYDTTGGTITIDGTDITQVSLDRLRTLIGNVSQDAILFNDTFFANIAFGMPNATLDDVIRAARIAHAHDFIMQTESGYYTRIGDRGDKLSGGQRQRISIARAILKNPPILILDEATSALDTESERLVQDSLEKLSSGRTTIAIAHRLSTIRQADIIYVLHEGRLVEQGNHDQLLAIDGYYRRLYKLQEGNPCGCEHK